MRLEKTLVFGTALIAAGLLWQSESSAQTVVYRPATVAPVETTETVYVGPDRAMLGTGVVVTAGTYVASIIVGAESNKHGDEKLYIPLVGPWLDIGERGGCPLGASSCNGETGNKVLLIADGVGQGLGALMIVASILAPEREVRRISTASAKPTLRFTPVTYRGGSGIAAFGTF